MGSVNDNFDLRSHPWLADIDFNDLLKFKLNAPIIPEVNDETDVDNFNSKFTSERPKMTILSEDMVKELEKYDEMFDGFYYDQILEQDEALMKAKSEICNKYNHNSKDIDINQSIKEEIEENNYQEEKYDICEEQYYPVTPPQDKEELEESLEIPDKEQ